MPPDKMLCSYPPADLALAVAVAARNDARASSEVMLSNWATSAE